MADRQPRISVEMALAVAAVAAFLQRLEGQASLFLLVLAAERRRVLAQDTEQGAGAEQEL